MCVVNNNVAIAASTTSPLAGCSPKYRPLHAPWGPHVGRLPRHLRTPPRCSATTSRNPRASLLQSVAAAQAAAACTAPPAATCAAAVVNAVRVLRAWVVLLLLPVHVAPGHQHGHAVVVSVAATTTTATACVTATGGCPVPHDGLLVVQRGQQGTARSWTQQA